ncbi:MAG TPA: UDP-glucose/GDP-mannose dehydrogenase family protein [Candidatus Binatia bacterium]|nr:UDP-glucose/GDP-mannose dehydrogenase family protein [Candidatus Binatia bacterium]
MKVTIFGSGYVGLVTAACFAERGNHVMCVDNDARKVEGLLQGQIPIHEPGLDQIVIRNAKAGRLQFTTDAAAGVAHGTVIFIAVGTPQGEDGAADLKYVLQVARTIGQHLDGYRVVVDKSTVPVGTADKVRAAIAAELKRRKAKHEFDVVSNPEFLKEGAAVDDFMKPDRIVVGADSARPVKYMREIYAAFNRNHDKLIVMSARSAELTKYAANTMLATKISLMNEFANIAEQVGADIEQVRIGIGSDSRIGFQFIYPGCGYGGSCFPKDVKALARTAEGAGYEPELIRTVDALNGRQKQRFFRKIEQHFGGKLKGRTLALWGLAFKPNTDDMREAPSRVVIDGLLKAGARVQAYDPEAGKEARRLFKGEKAVAICDSAEAAAKGADGLVIVTEWNEFRSPDFPGLKKLLKQPVIFDGRNLYEPAMVAGYGFRYFAVGRPEAEKHAA